VSPIAVLVLIGVLFYAVTCWAIMDVARRDFGSLARKAVWGVIVLVPFVGCVLYVLVGRRGSKGGQGQCEDGTGAENI